MPTAIKIFSGFILLMIPYFLMCMQLQLTGFFSFKNIQHILINRRFLNTFQLLNAQSDFCFWCCCSVVAHLKSSTRVLGYAAHDSYRHSLKFIEANQRP